MRKFWCSIFCVVILLCLLLSGCGLMSNSVTLDGVNYEKITYMKNGERNEGYTVSGCKAGTKVVNIVAEVNGLPVHSIKKFAFKDNTEIQEVIIPDSIESISLNTAPFMGCTNIEKITMPTAQLILLFNMYGGSSNDDPIPHTLKYVYLTSACTKISTSMFYHCTSLLEIHIPSSVTEIMDGTNIVSVGVNGHQVSSSKYDNLPFLGCSNLTIYCEATSKPDGWQTYWNYIDSQHQANVRWGNY